MGFLRALGCAHFVRLWCWWAGFSHLWNAIGINKRQRVQTECKAPGLKSAQLFAFFALFSVI